MVTARGTILNASSPLTEAQRRYRDAIARAYRDWLAAGQVTPEPAYVDPAPFFAR